MQAAFYFPADAPCPSVRVDNVPSAAISIGDVRLVFEDDRQLEQVLKRLGQIAERRKATARDLVAAGDDTGAVEAVGEEVRG